MFTILDLIFTGIVGAFVGMFIIIFIMALSSANKKDEEASANTTEKILTANNILLKISLLKMIIGFAQKDENGYYCTGVDGFVSDAFVRLGIESHKVNEQIALEKIERLDRQLGEV